MIGAPDSRQGEIAPGRGEETVMEVTLPAAEAGMVLDWARQLSGLAGGRPVQWSDSWSDEDLAGATAAAVRRFDDQEHR
jgi:hypothetical protein